jgi:hypothetical protein
MDTRACLCLVALLAVVSNALIEEDYEPSTCEPADSRICAEKATGSAMLQVQRQFAARHVIQGEDHSPVMTGPPPAKAQQDAMIAGFLANFQPHDFASSIPVLKAEEYIDINVSVPTVEPTLEIGTRLLTRTAANDSTSETANDSTSELAAVKLQSIRAEMAMRAFEVGDEDEELQQPVPIDENTDPSYISGSTASLDQTGYKALASICCPLEMSVFAQRLVNHLGFVVCNDGSLEGIVAWYYCANQTRTFAEMTEDVIAGADGDCAFIGTESGCPTPSSNCPWFPDTSAHRRRNCEYRKAANTTTTSPAPTVRPTTSSAPFRCERSEATALDFGGSTVTENNLGGMGPDTADPAKMTFQGIATYAGASVDLVVEASGLYTPLAVADNGVSNNHGQVNLESGNAVELTFRFQETVSGNSVRLPEFYFSILDLDQSDTMHQERVYAGGFAHALTEEFADFEAEKLTDGRTLYKSLQAGYDWDDPSDPMNLGVVADPSPTANRTVDQRHRAIMFVYRDTTEFSMTFEIMDRTGTAATLGQNFMFSGESSLMDLCPS